MCSATLATLNDKCHQHWVSDDRINSTLQTFISSHSTISGIKVNLNSDLFDWLYTFVINHQDIFQAFKRRIVYILYNSTRYIGVFSNLTKISVSIFIHSTTISPKVSSIHMLKAMHGDMSTIHDNE